MHTVGGTLVSKILGLSKWGGPLTAYFDLVGGDDGVDRKAEGLWLNRGKTLEESVLAMWAERETADVGRGERVTAPTLPHAHASLDAWGWSDRIQPRAILDAKTASSQEMGDEWGQDGTDRLPADYQLQGLWYLGVCKAAGMNVADEALFPTLVGPEAELQWAARLVTKTGRPLALADLDGTGLELRTYRVAWDAALFEEVNRKVLDFILDYVEPRRPPAPSPGDLPQRDMRSVAKSIRAEAGRVLEFDSLPPAEQALLLDLLDANRQRKAWEKAEEQAEARVKLAMGTAEEVRGLPGGARVAWKDTSAPGGTRRFQIHEPRRK